MFPDPALKLKSTFACLLGKQKKLKSQDSAEFVSRETGENAVEYQFAPHWRSGQVPSRCRFLEGALLSAIQSDFPIVMPRPPLISTRKFDEIFPAF
jgi:hypothetical protein